MTSPITPLLAVDIIVELPINHQIGIVLIERKNPPLGWALPGGFVVVGETVEAAAIREAKEETCLNITLLELLGVYSDPHRDPRGHTVSIVYITKGEGIAKAEDDAKNIGIFELDKIPDKLAFDHKKIISDYLLRYNKDE